MSAGTIDDLRRARRVLCFGVAGSGKSTMAEALGERLGLPVTFVDDLCWEPGWRLVPDAVQDARFEAVLGADAYVVDSVYRRQHELVPTHVDAIVGLDYSRAVSLTRLVRRTIRRVRTREVICNGNVETLARTLGPHSVIRWHFRAFGFKRAQMRAWHADASAPPVLLLERPSDADALLRQLGR